MGMEVCGYCLALLVYQLFLHLLMGVATVHVSFAAPLCLHS